MTTSSLPEKVQKTVAQHGLLFPKDTVLVAVSGGADSVCLAHVLHSLGVSIQLAHLNHQFRGDESRAGAEFVRVLAHSLGLDVHVESRPIAEEAAKIGDSFEVAARRARYAFLLRVAREQGCTAIATAHHADDQAETVLLRLIRGSSVAGLAGIPPLRIEQGIRIVRPLLECMRSEILAYIHEQSLTYCTDATNDDISVPRNRVRHRLLPLLRSEFNHNIRDALTQVSQIHRRENDFLEQYLDAFWRDCRLATNAIDRSRFRAGHIALQQRLVVRWLRDFGIEPNFELVEQIVCAIDSARAGAKIDATGKMMLHVSRRTVEMHPTTGQTRTATAVSIALSGPTPALGGIFNVRMIENKPIESWKFYCTPQRQVFDKDALGESLSVRYRRPGDRFTPLGMDGSRKLKDYFVGLGLSMTERDTTPILLAGDKIVWIVGHAISSHVAVTSTTRSVVEVYVARASSSEASPEKPADV